MSYHGCRTMSLSLVHVLFNEALPSSKADSMAEALLASDLNSDSEAEMSSHVADTNAEPASKAGNR